MKNFPLILCAAILMPWFPAAAQTNGTWNVNAGGDWSDPTRWTSNPDVPGGNGSIVALTFDITGNRVVTIDTISRTVGQLTIGDPNGSHRYDLAASGGAGLIFQNGGISAGLTYTSTAAAGTIFAPITLTDDLTVVNSSSNNQTILGDIGGADRNLTFTGAGAGFLTLSGANTYSGITTIGDATHAKTLVINGGSTATSQFQLNNAASILRFSIGASGEFVYNNTFTGSGTVFKNDQGTLALGGDNSGFSGTFAHQVGILRLDSANALGSANLSITRSNVGTLVGLNAGDFTRSIGAGANQFQVSGSGSAAFGFVAYGADRTVNIGGAAANINYSDLENRLILNDTSGTGTLFFANGLVLSGNRFLRVGDGSADVDAVLSGNLTGTGSLTISGGGTLRMDGTNSYTGAINLTEGTLLLGSTGSTSASSAVTVADGATLGGTGTAAGSVAIDGTLAPGNSIGTLNTGSLTLGATSILDIELGFDGINPVSDRVNVTGTVSITSGADLKLTLATGMNAPIQNNMFFLISNDGVDAITGAFTSLNGVATTLNEGSTFEWNSQQWIITYQADFGSLSFTGGNDLAIMVIPEPSTWALLGIGGLVALLARRRRS